MGQGDTVLNGVLGGLLGFVFQFVPVVGFLAPLAGGWLAGHLQKEGGGGGAKTGLIAGLLLLIQDGVFAVVIFLGFSVLGLATGDFEAFLLFSAFGAFSGGVIFLILGAYVMALALVGGVVGGAIAGSDDTRAKTVRSRHR